MRQSQCIIHSVHIGQCTVTFYINVIIIYMSILMFASLASKGCDILQYRSFPVIYKMKLLDIHNSAKDTVIVILI